MRLKYTVDLEATGSSKKQVIKITKLIDFLSRAEKRLKEGKAIPLIRP